MHFLSYMETTFTPETLSFRENHVTIISLAPQMTLTTVLTRKYVGSLKTHCSEVIQKLFLHSDRILKPYDINSAIW